MRDNQELHPLRCGINIVLHPVTTTYFAYSKNKLNKSRRNR